MHYALLIGYGASAVNPYLAIESLQEQVHRGLLPDGMAFDEALKHYKKAINKGLLKVFLEDGHLDAAELSRRADFRSHRPQSGLVDKYFTGTPSRIGGVGLDVLALEAKMKHDLAFEKNQ